MAGSDARRADPWERPAAQGRSDDWSRVGGAGHDDRPGSGGWDTVLPPVGGTPRVQDPGAAGVDEATAFLSHWGPPPLRPTEEPEAAPEDRGRPAPPSRAGAGRTADNPASPPRPGPGWSRTGRPSAALPPVANAPAPTADPELPAAPTEPAAERWIAERLASGRSASAGAQPAEGHFAGGPQAGAPGAGRAQAGQVDAGRAQIGGSDAGRARAGGADAGPPQAGGADAGPSAERADNDAISGWAAGRPATDERFAGYWAAEPPGGDERRGVAADRPGGAPEGGRDGERTFADQRAGARPGAGSPPGEKRFPGDGSEQTGDERPGSRRPGDGQQAGEDRFAGYWARDRAGEKEREGRDEPTEVLGPFDVGAWSRDAATAPARARGRQRQAERPEPVTEQPHDRVVARSESGGGRNGEPPKRGDEPPRPRRTFGDRIRAFARGIGQLFITLGLVLLLLAVYEVWFTDLVNHRTQKDLATSLQKQWDNGDDPTVGTGPAKPGEKVRSIPLGEGFALIYIPDFGTDYVFTLVEGTGADQLNKGPGHYVDTALPGQVGNVAIAGHRVGKGSPFLNLDKLKAGSAVVIRTKSYWYTYRVLGGPGGDADKASVLGFPGREIVDPSDVGVIAPVPDKPGATPSQRLLTLTTCHPKFTARQRMVIHAELDGTPFPVSKGIPPSMTST